MGVGADLTLSGGQGPLSRPDTSVGSKRRLGQLPLCAGLSLHGARALRPGAAALVAVMVMALVAVQVGADAVHLGTESESVSGLPGGFSQALRTAPMPSPAFMFARPIHNVGGPGSPLGGVRPRFINDFENVPRVARSTALGAAPGDSGIPSLKFDNPRLGPEAPAAKRALYNTISEQVDGANVLGGHRDDLGLNRPFVGPDAEPGPNIDSVIDAAQQMFGVDKHDGLTGRTVRVIESNSLGDVAATLAEDGNPQVAAALLSGGLWRGKGPSFKLDADGTLGVYYYGLLSHAVRASLTYATNDESTLKSLADEDPTVFRVDGTGVDALRVVTSTYDTGKLWVAIRGSQSSKDWMRNFDEAKTGLSPKELAKQQAPPLLDGKDPSAVGDADEELPGYLRNTGSPDRRDQGDLLSRLHLHRGFVRAAEAVMGKLEARGLLDGTDSVRLSGHSAGGAVAEIVALLLDARGISVEETVTFGSPKWVNELGAKELERAGKLDRLLRINDDHDVVPCVPLYSLLGAIGGEYAQAGAELLLASTMFDYEPTVALKPAGSDRRIFANAEAASYVISAGAAPHNLHRYMAMMARLARAQHRNAQRLDLLAPLQWKPWVAMKPTATPYYTRVKEPDPDGLY